MRGIDRKLCVPMPESSSPNNLIMCHHFKDRILLSDGCQLIAQNFPKCVTQNICFGEGPCVPLKKTNFLRNPTPLQKAAQYSVHVTFKADLSVF